MKYFAGATALLSISLLVGCANISDPDFGQSNTLDICPRYDPVSDPGPPPGHFPSPDAPNYPVITGGVSDGRCGPFK